MKAILHRLNDNTEVQSLGRLFLFDGLDLPFKCVTLELPDKNNQNNISRIPAGTYRVVRRWSKKFGNHFHLLDVEGRSLILIHVGNYFTQIEGCILVGTRFTDINKDGELDVVSSGYTMRRLLSVAPEEFELTIMDLDK